MTKRTSSTVPRLLLCADIRHTLGATEYAFLSFLSFAMRGRSALGLASVDVQMPRSLGGLRMEMLQTRPSLEALSDAAGIMPWFDQDQPIPCDHAHYDIRITDKLTSQLPAPGVVPPVYNTTLHPPVAGFIDDIWSYLRAAIAAHDIESGGRQRPLRVSLSLVQASLGPLAHAGATLHTEALSLIRELTPAAPPAASRLGALHTHAPSLLSTSTTSPCAYVFLGLFLGVGKSSLGNRSKSTEAFRRSIVDEVVREARSRGVGCARLNAVFDSPSSEATAAALFGKVDGAFGLSFVEKRTFHSPVEQWREFADASHAAGRAGAEAPTAELLDNLVLTQSVQSAAAYVCLAVIHSPARANTAPSPSPPVRAARALGRLPGTAAHQPFRVLLGGLAAEQAFH